MSGRAAYLAATVGGLGDRLPAPGTLVGSLAAALAFLALALVAPAGLPVVAPVVLLVLVPLASWSAGVEAARRGEGDPGAIVIDEAAGQWLALAVLTAGLGRPPSPGELLASFAAFRLLDIVKPWPIRRLERLPGGIGILADDLAAGLAAAALQLLALRLV